MKEEQTTQPTALSRTSAKLIRRGLAATAIAVTVAAGCASTTTLDSLDPATQNLVLFESGWQCEVDRFAVDDPASLEQMRLDRQTDHEISAAAYETFLVTLADDDTLQGSPLSRQLLVSTTGTRSGCSSGSSNLRRADRTPRWRIPAR